MHDEAYAAVERIAAAYGLLRRKNLAVLDIGGRNINGTVKDLFATNVWVALDAVKADGVDIVADARTWEPDRFYDLVVCTEVLEHVHGWPAILATAANALTDDGVLIVTCASDRRPPHGAAGGPWPEPGEHYRNVQPAELAAALADVFPGNFGLEYSHPPGDLYAWARKTGTG